MKKSVMFLSAALLMLCMVFFSGCDKDDKDDVVAEVPVSPIKKIVFSPSYDAEESYEFTYDANDRVSSITNIYDGGAPNVITFDYSVANQLTITKEDFPTVYALDGSGRITKEFWNEEKTEWVEYQYNTDGYLTKIIEHWDGIDHTKFTIDITDGNVVRHTRFNDAGEVNRIKEFTFFTNATAANVNELQETNAVDSNWKVVGGFFGKPSAKLVDFLEYWNGPGDEANKKTTTLTHTFDDKDRVSTMTRVGDGFTEAYTFTYYED